MPESDNILTYVIYAVILVVFFIVLKSPKKSKDTQANKEHKPYGQDKTKDI